VAEDGGANTDVHVRIQKARRSFSKLRKVWLSTLIRKDTKIKIFNACMKSVLLYGCETWLVTSEIGRKIQAFVNRCLRYILRIWWPNVISNKDLWRVTGQEDINLEIRKRRLRWIGHTLRKEDGEIPKLPYYGTLKEVGREEDLRMAGEDRSSKKWVEAGMK